MGYNRFEDPKHIKWAKEVKKRDKYTCRVCRAQNVYLNSHHLNSWDWCEELRFAVANGITLCYQCHESYHLIYGAGKNTSTQFKEFLEIVNLIKGIVREKHERKRQEAARIQICLS